MWKEKAKGLKLDYEMKILNMKNKEKDDLEAGKSATRVPPWGSAKLQITQVRTLTYS